MNQTHIHLLLNHVSILAAIFSVAIYIAGYIRKNDSVKDVALVGFVLAAMAAIPVFATGEAAEETVEHLPGVLESTIEAHEEAAELAIWLIEIMGIAALAGLLLKNVRFVSSSAFSIVMILLSIISSASISYTGFLGGKIRHTELSSTTSVTQGAEEKGQTDGNVEEEDD